MPIEACFYIDEPPEIEFVDGMFRITQRVGNYSFERAMQPSTFFKTVALGEEAIRQYQETGTARVITVEFDSKFKRVFPKDKCGG